MKIPFKTIAAGLQASLLGLVIQAAELTTILESIDLTPTGTYDFTTGTIVFSEDDAPAELARAADVEPRHLIARDAFPITKMKLAKARRGEASNVLKVFAIGDSLTFQAMGGVLDRLSAEYNVPIIYAGSAETLSTRRMNHALEGSATLTVKNDYDISPQGNYFTLNQSTSDAVRFWDQSGSLFNNVDVIDVYYVAENGAGTFDVELSSTSTSSGFIKQGSTVDADNGASATLTHLAVAPTQDNYAIRLVPQSGTVRVAFVVAYDSTGNAIVVLNMGESSATPSNISATSSATWSTLLDNFSPDLLTWQYADRSPQQDTGLDALSAALTASTADPEVLLLTPWAQENDDVAPTVLAMTAKASAKSWSLFDCFGTFGSSWATLNMLSLSDGVHPEAALEDATANLIYQVSQFEYTLASAAAVSTSLNFRPDPKKVAMIKAASTSIHHSEDTFNGGRGLAAWAWVRAPNGLVSKGIFSQRQSSSLNNSWSLATNAEGDLTFFASSSTNNSSNRRTILTDVPVDFGDWVLVGIDFSNGELKIYLNGAEAESSVLNNSGTLSSLFDASAPVMFGQNQLTGSTNFVGDIEVSEYGLFNKSLSSDEWSQLANGGPSLNEFGRGESTLLTSGSLVVGAEYRIDSFQSGDDFTNVGAASNADNVTFVATGTTPTSWSNFSSLQRVGLCLYVQPTLNGRQVHDRSGNGKHGLVEGTLKTIFNQAQSNEYTLIFEGLDASSGALNLGDIGGENDLLPANSVIETYVFSDRADTGTSMSFRLQRTDNLTNENLNSPVPSVDSGRAASLVPSEDQDLSLRGLRIVSDARVTDVDLAISGKVLD
ncbi:MAG: LamG-like jellyroll fold domain-containing protein [Verrucomicrobiota bacterium]